MKKCPYCAEMIQDEAIKCRYCFSDLTVPPPASGASGAAAPSTSGSAEPADASATETTGTEPAGAADGGTTVATEGVSTATADGTTVAAEGVSTATADGTTVAADGGTSASADGTTEVRYTHSGYRYVLGYGADFFGIWDRQSPSTPSERFPRTDDGWQQAWTRFVGMEPNHVAVPAAGGGTTSPADNDVMQYTHSGQRYLLGYGRTFFGIWDRQAPALPVERFDRNDAGWAAAWHRYNQLESHYTEVGLSSSSGGSSSGEGGGG